MCEHCHAYKGKHESAKFCCGQGTINEEIIQIPTTPDEWKLWFDTDKKFRDNLRKYNNSCALASLGFDSEERMPGFNPTLKISGRCYHRIGALKPEEGQPKKFAQFFVHDTEEEKEEIAAARIKAQKNPSGMDLEKVLIIQETLNNINPYVQDFKMVSELPDSFFEERKMILRKDGMPHKEHKGTVNLPAPETKEVAIITLDDRKEPADVQVYHRGGEVYNITDLNAHYDPLHFVLLNPKGEKGWHPNLRTTEGKKLTPAKFYRFMFQVRDKEKYSNHLHKSSRLMQEYACAEYYKLERQRLKWIEEHQQEIHADKYMNVKASIEAGETEFDEVKVLPNSYPGSRRWYEDKFGDGMAISREFGKPHLFITITANAKWETLTGLDKDGNKTGGALFDGQDTTERPDMVARIFHDQMKDFEDDLIKNDAMGRVIAFLGMTEWQKRGLPHRHYFIWLHPDDAPKGNSCFILIGLIFQIQQLKRYRDQNF